LKIQIGNTLTVPRILYTALLVFALTLFQNLPQQRLPTLEEFYKALIVAGIVALVLLLRGGENGNTNIPVGC
jgi:hypothetical protein